MLELQTELARWADQTFGDVASLERLATRANEELAELLRGIAAGQPNDQLIMEAADSAIVLSRVAHLCELDLAGCADEHGPYRRGEGDQGTMRRHAMDAAKQMIRLVAHCFAADQTGHRQLGQPGREALGCVFAHLRHGCHSLGGDLISAMMAKHSVNLRRTWHRTGDGHGYHERDKPTALLVACCAAVQGFMGTTGWLGAGVRHVAADADQLALWNEVEILAKRVMWRMPAAGIDPADGELQIGPLLEQVRAALELVPPPAVAAGGPEAATGGRGG